MRILVLLLITLLCCGACKEQYDHKGKTALVEVDGNFLYKEDLMSVLPVGLSKDDSILFAEHYIRSWAEEILLYEKAANNIPDNVDVDKPVSYTHLIHQPMGGAQGQASDIEITAREIQKLKKELYTIIADHSHTDFDKVWADSDRDYWMTAQEAKEYGMIDEVLIKK